MEPNDSDGRGDLLGLTSTILAAFVSRNSVPATELPALIKSVHSTLSGLGGAGHEAGIGTGGQRPAVPIRRSVTHDHIVCLEDGKKLKMLKRYLRTQYGLSPEEYRAKWGLPYSYPMVAPAYAAKRSDVAKQIGLGRKKAQLPKLRKRG